ncbi:MAG: type II toxin-antitoxin system HicA family toxin [Nitrospirota bacterium]|nr:type II toxin-antitoxin system HicA family toxin [Nitrospirota bacterium]
MIIKPGVTGFNPSTKKRVIVPYHKKDLPKGTLMSIIKAAELEEEFE